MPTQTAADFATSPPTDIVKNIANKLLRRLPSTVRYDDLYSAGLTGLVEASHRFNNRRGVEFRTYAKHRVYGAMLDELRRLDTVSRDRRRAIREGRDEETLPAPRLVSMWCSTNGALREDVAEVESDLCLEEQVDRQRAQRRMLAALATLTPRLQQVYRMRIEEGCKLREIADHFGVTEARASQLTKELAKALRQAMLNGAEPPSDA